MGHVHEYEAVLWTMENGEFFFVIRWSIFNQLSWNFQETLFILLIIKSLDQLKLEKSLATEKW